MSIRCEVETKCCFVTIHNKDELCAARAIVTAIAKIEGFSNYRDYKDERSIQRTKALDLHHKAGVPLTPCGIEEIKLLCYLTINWLWSVGTISMPLSTKVLIRRSPFICTITMDTSMSMPAFLGRVYFCLKCEKGYNTEDWSHHSCANKCRCCHHTACPNQGEVGSWILCAQCHRMFKGPGCFENHQR